MLAALIVGLIVQGQTPHAAEMARVRTVLDTTRTAKGFPGATAAVVFPDGTVESVAVGLANKAKGTPMKPTDRMLAGSIGKTYFAVAILQLAKAHRISLDEKVSQRMSGQPWFDDLPNAKEFTYRMLLSHSSGIPEHVEQPEFIKALKADPDKVWKHEELLGYVKKEPVFEAGKGFSYADTNFIVAGIAVERITKKDLYREIDRRILKPLHLTATSPSDKRTLRGLIPGYSSPRSPFAFEGPSIVDGKMFINPQMEWAGGGFVSTSSDLARWAAALYGGRVLSKDLMDQMLTAIPANTGRGDKYGLGVQVRQSAWGTSLGHGGWFPGYVSEMEYFPDLKMAVAVQFNTDDTRLIGRSTHGMIQEVVKAIRQE
jgi:D-alanyl-D-alanine carboxypeptidase